MTRFTPRPRAASVRQRLYNLSVARGEVFDLVLTRFALERLLYRLGQSRWRDGFVLKGAMLYALWGDVPHRPTRDIDLLGLGSPDLERLATVFRELCVEDVEDDGLDFLDASVVTARIRDQDEYLGVRVNLEARLGQARIHLQVDVGFGDAVVPAPLDGTFPTMLDHTAPYLRHYPLEAVVAEKLHAIAHSGHCDHSDRSIVIGAKRRQIASS